MTDSFNAAQFEQALHAATDKPIAALGYVQGELTFSIVLDPKVLIEVRSTIDQSGLNRGTSKDSIRLWLREINSTQPLGKLDKWTNRTTGWQERLTDKINQLIELRALAGDCPTCQNPAAVWIVQNGQNEGKTYAKCMKDGKWLKWIHIKTDGVNKTKTVKKPTTKGNALAALDAHEEQAPVVIKKQFTPSDKQVAVGDFVTQQGENLRVEAVAGSGKTTTLQYVSNRLDPKLTVKAMVFNKRNATDMQTKLPPNVQASTAHSAAFADIRRVTPRVKVDDRKMWDLFNNEIHTLKLKGNEITAEEMQGNATEILRLVSLCKNTLQEPTEQNLNQLTEHHGITLGTSTQDAYTMIQTLARRSLEVSGQVIDFDDMVMLPALGRIEVNGETHIYNVVQSDLLFVDEAQDTNKAQQEYYLKAGRRLVFVGDKFQAVYGFRGADTDAMDNLTQKLNAQQLPLSICYRCSRTVIELAKTIVPQIEARPDAPNGSIQTIYEDELLKKVSVGDTMVICRTNAPLVKPAFELIRNGVKAVILGKDIGKGLVVLVRKIQRKHGISNAELNLLLSKLHDYVTTEASRLYIVHKDSQAAMLEDQFETLVALSDACQTITEVERKIESVFSDEVDGIPFASIHKSKGTESKNIFLLRPDLLPFAKATQAWEKEIETHLQYIAWTRAMENFYYVQ